MKERTWLEDSVIERAQLISKAKASGEQIHLGELMSIASTKFFEMAPENHKYKGRIFFRGDIVKDQNGSAAIFQELSANPTNVHDANANLAYGIMPGHTTTQSDALRAYIQSLFKSKHKTWVRVPKEDPPTVGPSTW